MTAGQRIELLIQCQQLVEDLDDLQQQVVTAEDSQSIHESLAIIYDQLQDEIDFWDQEL
jgi:hypothetical protein